MASRSPTGPVADITAAPAPQCSTVSFAKVQVVVGLAYQISALFETGGQRGDQKKFRWWDEQRLAHKLCESQPQTHRHACPLAPNRRECEPRPPLGNPDWKTRVDFLPDTAYHSPQAYPWCRNRRLDTGLCHWRKYFPGAYRHEKNHPERLGWRIFLPRCKQVRACQSPLDEAPPYRG